VMSAYGYQAILPFIQYWLEWPTKRRCPIAYRTSIVYDVHRRVAKEKESGTGDETCPA